MICLPWWSLGNKAARGMRLSKKPKKHWAGGFDTVGHISVKGTLRDGKRCGVSLTLHGTFLQHWGNRAARENIIQGAFILRRASLLKSGLRGCCSDQSHTSVHNSSVELFPLHFIANRWVFHLRDPCRYLPTTRTMFSPDCCAKNLGLTHGLLSPAANSLAHQTKKQHTASHCRELCL